jgi:hypothetical protein
VLAVRALLAGSREQEGAGVGGRAGFDPALEAVGVAALELVQADPPNLGDRLPVPRAGALGQRHGRLAPDTAEFLDAERALERGDQPLVLERLQPAQLRQPAIGTLPAAPLRPDPGVHQVDDHGQERRDHRDDHAEGAIGEQADHARHAQHSSGGTDRDRDR